MNAVADSLVQFPQPLPDANHFVFVDEGEYRASYIGAEGFFLIGRRPKAVLWFQLHDEQRSVIGAYYNLYSLDDLLKGSRKRNPTFTVGWRSRLVRDLATLWPDQYSPRNLPATVPSFESKPVTVKVRTVVKDMTGERRSEAFHSSVIDRIAGWAE